MIYDAFAHLPLYGLEDLGFVPRGEAGRFIAERNTAPGGKLPLNTNGGGLSYMHSGMYGMYALQESVRQMRGIAPAQIPDAKISVCHGVGGMFAASGTIIFSNQAQTVESDHDREPVLRPESHRLRQLDRRAGRRDHPVRLRRRCDQDRAAGRRRPLARVHAVPGERPTTTGS